MGLDMYLKANRYLSQFDDEENKISEKVKELLPTMPGRINVLESEAIYWRKANAIHKWFVDNVQEGKDDCGSYYVSQDNLRELKDICERVLADNSLAEELLPSQSGFFFGGTDYDEWYFKDLKFTAEEIGKLLKIHENENHSAWSYEYHSSW
jgi:hypothetical protein